MKKYYLLLLLGSSFVQANNTPIKFYSYSALRCRSIGYEQIEQRGVLPIIKGWSRKSFITLPKALISLLIAFSNKDITRLTLFQTVPNEEKFTQDYQLHTPTSLSLATKNYYDMHNNYMETYFKRDWNDPNKKDLFITMSLFVSVLQPAIMCSNDFVFDSDVYQIGSLDTMINLSNDKTMSQRAATYIMNNDFDFNHRNGYFIFPALPGVLEHIYSLSTSSEFFFVGKSHNISYEDEWDKSHNVEACHVMAVKLRKSRWDIWNNINRSIFDYMDTKGHIYKHGDAITKFREDYAQYFPLKEEDSSEGDPYA